jgi:diadenosine tetraphosphatase ApaH/serine/threonine PP2A family protein phosphatase
LNIALLSDIHANAEALRACLRHAEERHVDRFAFLGDFVGYGADPGEVVDTIAAYASRGAIVVKGNHDQAVDGRSLRDLSDEAFASIEWTIRALSDAQKNFLAGLPMIVRDSDICFVHASAAAPEKWEYIQSSATARESMEAAATSYVFSGHVHEQLLYFKTLAGKTAAFRPTSGSAVPIHAHHSWLAIAGSAGQPRDGNPSAAYAIFDTSSEEITFHRVPYDHMAAAKKVRSAGLPEVLAQRLENAI